MKKYRLPCSWISVNSRRRHSNLWKWKYHSRCQESFWLYFQAYTDWWRQAKALFYRCWKAFFFGNALKNRFPFNFAHTYHAWHSSCWRLAFVLYWQRWQKTFHCISDRLQLYKRIFFKRYPLKHGHPWSPCNWCLAAGQTFNALQFSWGHAVCPATWTAECLVYPHLSR